MKDQVGKVREDIYILTHDKYTEFIGRLRKQLEVKKMVLLRFINAKKDEKKEETLEPSSNSEYFWIFF